MKSFNTIQNLAFNRNHTNQPLIDGSTVFGDQKAVLLCYF